MDRSSAYSAFSEILDEQGKTAYEVSKNTGIPTSTLTAWKKGLYVPKVDKLLKIANYLNVPLEVFL